MPFEVIRNDITKMKVDAIVNTANPRAVIGAGTDAMIHQAAGPKLLEARRRIGDIAVGKAAITPGYALPAKYVIHTVGPLWEGGQHKEAAHLRACYDRSLLLARDRGCQSIAFPLICAGRYGYPRDEALQIAIAAFTAFLTEHEMQIYLVVFDNDSYRLSEKLFRDVASYIDDHYVKKHRLAVRSVSADASVCESRCFAAPLGGKASSLEDMLKREDAGFSETLLRLIAQSGKKESEIYKKANLSKQHFSKIRNNPNYQPTKPTAIALALALELELDAVQDLIGRAGYTLTNSSKFDLIILYYIEQKNYNVVEINVTLYDFDQMLL